MGIEISNIVDLISSGRIKETIKIIENYLKANNHESVSDFYKIKLRLERNDRDFALGVQRKSDYHIEKNKINVSLLNLVQQLEDDNTDSVSIVLSYSYNEEEYAKKLKKALASFEEQKLINIKSDDEILPGTDWSEKKLNNSNITSSDILVLLISSNFLASEYFWIEELSEAFDLNKKGIIDIVPIIVEDCNWDELESLKNIKIFPKDGQSLKSSKSLDKSLAKITQDFKKIIFKRKTYKEQTKYLIDSFEIRIKNSKRKENLINEIETVLNYYRRVDDNEKTSYYGRLLDDARFNYNISNPIIIHELSIDNVSIFNEIKWTLTPNINLILGKNGFGKSHLLRLIPCLLQQNKSVMDLDFRLFTYSNLKIVVEQENTRKEIYYNDCMFLEGTGKVPVLAIPSVRTINRKSETSSVYHDDISFISKASYNFIHQTPFDEILRERLFIFGSNLLKENRTDATDFTAPITKNVIAELIGNIISELTQSKFQLNSVSEFVGESRIEINVKIDKNEEEVPLKKVSQGTISIISIILLIFDFLRSLNPRVKPENVLKRKAIVLIDEIDAHLHPSWQQIIIGILRRTFPKVQFILTAHSPLVVSGCFEKEVTVLRRNEENGKFSLKQFENNFIGKDIIDIYNIVFEMENVNNDETYLKYLTQRSKISEEKIEAKIKILEAKETLTEKEEIRLKDLYRIVNIAKIEDARNKLDSTEEIETLNAKLRDLEYQLSKFHNADK